jgi:enoyl-CoA hydratase/carnithine racemase
MIEQRTEGTVLCAQRGHVLLVTLNRPDVLNSLTVEMDAEYREVLAEAERDADVRAIVVTGAGRAFCAGADFAALEAPVHAPLLLSKPLIAAVNGGCVGLGLATALFCDVRFVADEAKIGTAFAQRGVVAEQGMAFLLSRIVGEGNARDLLLSARLIRGPEAVRMGLATRSVPREEVVQAATDYAEEIARTCAPGSLAVIKEQMRENFLADYRREAAKSLALLREAFRGADYAEGILSYQEKRAPRFPGISPDPLLPELDSHNR